MKKFIIVNAVMLVMAVLLGVCILYLATEEKKEEEKSIETIVNSYVNDRGYEVFILSDGSMAEVILNKPGYKDHVRFYDREHNQLSLEIEHNPIFEKWLNAEVGDTVINWGGYYEIKISPNMCVERKVIRVTKYDGNLNKITGKIELSAGVFGGTSGEGSISGEGMGTKNMFINIFFEDRDPITVNAKENQLWLDVEEGMIVLEQRINGKTFFSPRF